MNFIEGTEIDYFKACSKWQVYWKKRGTTLNRSKNIKLDCKMKGYFSKFKEDEIQSPPPEVNAAAVRSKALECEEKNKLVWRDDLHLCVTKEL